MRHLLPSFHGLVVGLLVLCGAAAAAPSNDDVQNATLIPNPIPQVVNGSNVGATKQLSEPNHAGYVGGASVWWMWTPPAPTRVIINTFGSNFDTLLAVYRYTGGSLPPFTNLSLVAQNDQYGGDQSQVTIDALGGTTYYIAVDGWNNQVGNITLTLQPPPPNDAYATAIPLPQALPITAGGTNSGASKETVPDLEPDHAGWLGGASVWWSWTPNTNGTVTISTAGSDFYTLLAVYTEGGAVPPFANLVRVTENVLLNWDSTYSQVSFDFTSGTKYMIAVDTRTGTTGRIKLSLSNASPPTNDDIANATLLSGALPIAVTVPNFEATKESGELWHGGTPGFSSVWWKWTPAASGKVTISTENSDFNTIVAVYRDTAPPSPPVAFGDLFEEASNAWYQGNSYGQVTLNVNSTDTYYIVVDGYSQAYAQGTINLLLVQGPANDDVANATTLSGTFPITTTGSNRFASKETTLVPPEPDHAGNPGGASVWWKWQAPSTMNVTVSLEGSNLAASFAVYVKTADPVPPYGNLNLVADNSATGGQYATFSATAGNWYYIAVDGWGGQSGYIVLTLVQPPANDMFANATNLTGQTLPNTVTGSNRYASREPGEPTHGQDPADTGGASVWWKWQPAANGMVTISTSGSDLDTTLAVYTAGPAIVAKNDNFGGKSTSQVTINVSSATMYYIAVDGFNGVQGSIQLAFSSPPANDNIANAIALSGSLPIATTGSNQYASKEAGEPGHGGNTGGTSVWWKWTPAATGKVTITTAGSNFNTLLGVYTVAGAVPPFSNLVLVAQNDDYGGTTSQVTFDVLGTLPTYYIAVDGSQGASGNISLTIAQPPANDDFANGTAITASLPTTVSGSNVYASKQSGEPYLGVSAGTSVWWTWTAPATTAVTFATAGSSFDTLLAVGTGNSLSTMNWLAFNDDFSGAATSQVTIYAQSGTVYRILVDGVEGASGSISLAARAGNPPGNDNFSAAYVGTTYALSATLPASAAGSNVDATKESGEPDHAFANTGASVWWKWTPATTQKVTVSTAGSTFPAVLGIYIGNGVASLTGVASTETGQLTVNVVAGTLYMIAVDGVQREAGSITLTIASPPANDDIGKAIALNGVIPAGTTGTNVGATKEQNEPNHADNDGGASVWWTWTPVATGTVIISTYGSGFDTILAVYKQTDTRFAGSFNLPDGTLTGFFDGQPDNNLQVVSGGANDDFIERTSQVTIAATGGQTYWIAVDGTNDGTGAKSGSIALKVIPYVAPDLTIKSIAYSPTEPTPGQAVTFTVTVENSSAADAGFTNIGFFGNSAAAPAIDAAPDQTRSASVVPANSTKDLTFVVTAPSVGSYTAWAFVDQSQDVFESNESNNAGPTTPANGQAWTVLSPPVAPAITSALTATGIQGTAFSYQITATGPGPIIFSASNLPSGLTVSGDTITGTPTVYGTYVVGLTATNSVGSNGASLVITLGNPKDNDNDGFSNELESAAGVATDPNNAASTPFGGNQAGTAQALGVTSLKIKLDLSGATGKDGIGFSGFFPAPASVTSVADQTIIVDIAGIVRAFTLDSKGSSPKGNETLKAKLKAGKLTVQEKLNKGTYAASLADEGFTTDSEGTIKTVRITILCGQTMFQKDQYVEFAAKGTKGSGSGIGTESTGSILPSR
jgi:hypothetical protein